MTGMAGRLYRGLWQVLADWFAVPEEPPDLPAIGGESVKRFRPSPDFLRYLKFKFWVVLALVDAVLLVAWIGTFLASITLGLLLTPVFLAVAILPDIVAFVAIQLRYDTTWYVLSNRSLRIRRGIWVIRETTITFENVQNIKLKQGPVQRHFGVADIELTLAGGGATSNESGANRSSARVGLIEGVSDADQIRDLILARVRMSRASGLGDELALSSPPGAAWSTDHLNVLREIRDELAGSALSGTAGTSQ
jgi:membrane protein YdbS with pleckstrin-like domain